MGMNALKKEKRFKVVEKQNLGFAQEATILRDNQTGVQYLFVAQGYAGGLSPLLGKDGNPVIEAYMD